MKRSMWAIPAGAITAVLIGAAISAGPVMWAVLTLAAPLVVMLVLRVPASRTRAPTRGR